jgi:fucose 4-O-acetylase-like acetyltransferase
MRDRTIDAAKGLGILLVVLGHSRLAPSGGELHRLIFSFHMPLFFVLAGVFLRAGDGLLPAARARAATLLWPYAAVSLAVGIVRLPRLVATPEWPEAGLQFVAGVLYGTGPTIPWPPLWFLPHLFLASLLALVLAKLARGPVREGLLAAVLLVAGTVIVRAGIAPARGLPWSADLLPVTVAWVLVGHALGPALRGAALPWPGLLLAAAGVAALHFGTDAVVDLNRRQIDSPLVTTLQTLLGIGVCLGFASLLAATRAGAALCYLGARTMPVLLLHWFLLAAVFAALADRGAGFGASAVASVAAACLLPLFLHAIWTGISARAMGGALRRPGSPRPGRGEAEKNLS